MDYCTFKWTPENGTVLIVGFMFFSPNLNTDIDDKINLPNSKTILVYVGGFF